MKPKAFDNKLICRDFCCNVSTARTPGTNIVQIINLFCHSICDVDDITHKTDVFVLEQCRDEIYFVLVLAHRGVITIPAEIVRDLPQSTPSPGHDDRKYPRPG